MKNYIKKTLKTEWGLDIILMEDIFINDSNILPSVKVLLDECKKTENKNKVIIDASTVTQQVSILKLIDIAELLQTECLRIKTAIIAPNLVNDEISRNTETVSFNRGILIKSFLDRETAMAWLLNQELSVIF
jgi:hypothetical protein